VNKIRIIGNLGRDPEMRYTTTGQAITSFSVASNHNYTDSMGMKHSETEWFNCSAFGKLAETCNEYLHKGQQVYVEGRLKSRTYQTKDGQTRYSLDVTVNDIQFLGQRPGRQSPMSTPTERPEEDGEEVASIESLDDLPF
jgi:single-strand DNA-binding protein